MDLSELRGTPITRHPWETSRVRALEKIVRSLDLPAPSALDIGCGDGYLGRALGERLFFREVVAQDIHLSDEIAQALSGPNLRFVRELDGLDYRADLLLLLDVLEHVESPRVLLTQVSRERLASGGRMVLTVPTFQSLFAEHDVALEHVRRYSRRELMDEVTAAGLIVIDAGYLFPSLLPVRALSVLCNRLTGPRTSPPERHGVGAWRAPALVTRLLHTALSLDNDACLAAHQLGVRLPGLSVWLTCKAPL